MTTSPRTLALMGLILILAGLTTTGCATAQGASRQPETRVYVRISRGSIDPARFEQMAAAMKEAEASLAPAIRRLPGLVSYYVAVDRASSSMVNVSIWDSLEHAQAMSTLPEMLALRAPFEAMGVKFEPIVNYQEIWRLPSAPGTGHGPVARFGRGDFLESIAVAADGTLFINLMRLNGDTQLARIKPGQAPEVFATLPNIGGVALAADGTPYVSVTAFGNKGNTPGIWKADPSNGKLSLVVNLPQNAFPNGLTFDPAGNLFVADSALSTLWRIAPGASQAEPWLRHDMLAPVSQLQGIPGANGVKFFKGSLYVSNSARGAIVRVPVEAGGKAGQPAIHAQVEGPDDFAVDEQGGLYVTQHLRNALVYVPPEGGAVSRTVAGTQQGLWGPTAAAFGRTPGDETHLYIVTDGNWYQGVLNGKQDELQDSLVVRLDAGVRGLAQP